jgi:hypothetical protein
LLAKAESEREKALAEQQGRVTADISTMQAQNSIHPAETPLMKFDFGAERAYSAPVNTMYHAIDTANEPEAWQSSNSSTPALRNLAYIGAPHYTLPSRIPQPIDNISPADTHHYVTIPERGRDWPNPYSPMVGINHGTPSDSLNWAMQDDITQEPMQYPGMQSNNRLNNGFPAFFGGW